jgi:aspartyl-tRNA synthetase
VPSYTRKQIDELTEWLKRPQIGVTGMIYCRYNADGTIKSSVDKFYERRRTNQLGSRFQRRKRRFNADTGRQYR